MLYILSNFSNHVLNNSEKYRATCFSERAVLNVKHKSKLNNS